MLVHVSKRDIAQGRMDDCRACPVARALNRAIRKGQYTVVGTNDFDVYNDDEQVARSIPLPPEAVTFIESFDGGQKVGPFCFNVEVPA